MSMNKHLRTFGEFTPMVVFADIHQVTLCITRTIQGYKLRYRYLIVGDGPKYVDVNLDGLTHLLKAEYCTDGLQFHDLEICNKCKGFYNSLNALFLGHGHDTIRLCIHIVEPVQQIYCLELIREYYDDGVRISGNYKVLCTGTDIFNLKVQPINKYNTTLINILKEKSYHKTAIKMVESVCEIFNHVRVDHYVSDKIALLASDSYSKMYTVCGDIWKKYLNNYDD